MLNLILCLRNRRDYFPDNFGDYSEEQGKRFHQDLKTMEQRYQGKWDVNMLADYCWNLKRDLPEQKRPNKRKPITLIQHPKREQTSTTSTPLFLSYAKSRIKS